MPKPKVAQIRLEPSAVDTRSLALDVQVGGTPGAPGASLAASSAMGEVRVVAHAAIDEDGRAGDVARKIGDQHGSHLTDLACLAHPSEGILGLEVAQAVGVAPDCLVDRCFNGAGRQCQ